MKLNNISNTDKRKWIEFIPDKNYPTLTEHIYMVESEYLNYKMTLDGIKQASNNNELQLITSMNGNFGLPELFMGTENELYEYLQEERNDELNSGNVWFSSDSINLNISTLKKHLKISFN